MPGYSYIALIPLLPLLAFIILGIRGRSNFKANAGIFATALLLVSTTLALYTAYNYFFINGKIDGVYHNIVAFKYTWLQFSPNLSIDMGVILDPISVMMIVVITFISLMVHIFSLGYMKGEDRYILCVPGIIYFFNAGTGIIRKHFADVYFLGIGWCFLFSFDWLLF